MGDTSLGATGVVLVVSVLTLSIAVGAFTVTSGLLSDEETANASITAATGGTVTDLKITPHHLNLDNNGNGRFTAHIDVSNSSRVVWSETTLTVAGVDVTLTPVRAVNCRGTKCTVNFSRAALRDELDSSGNHTFVVTVTWQSGFTSRASDTVRVTTDSSDAQANAEGGNQTTTTQTTRRNTTTTNQTTTNQSTTTNQTTTTTTNQTTANQTTTTTTSESVSQSGGRVADAFASVASRPVGDGTGFRASGVRARGRW